MQGTFSHRVRDVIALSREEALRLRHDHIGAEHLLLGLLREGGGTAVNVLRALGCDLGALKAAVEARVGRGDAPSEGNLPLTKQAEKMLRFSDREARRSGSDVIGTEHLLLSLLHEADPVAADILQSHFGVTRDAVLTELGAPLGEPDAFEPWRGQATVPPERVFQTEGEKRRVEVLDLHPAPPAGGAYSMVLQEVEGARRVPIIIGPFEAQAIAMELENVRAPRPMTHDLLLRFADCFDLKITEACVDRLYEGTFCAYLRVQAGEQEALIDARPSDAVALAVRAGAALYVHRSVLDAAGIDAGD